MYNGALADLGMQDLISYNVESVSPFVLSECAEGTGMPHLFLFLPKANVSRPPSPGGLCGAVFLDQDFERWLKQRLSTVWEQVPSKDLKRMINDSWEHGIKQEFDGTDKEFIIPLPFSCALKLNQADITLERWVRYLFSFFFFFFVLSSSLAS